MRCIDWLRGRRVKFVVIGRRTDKRSDIIEWWVRECSNQRTAHEICSELNEESMFNGTGWYYVTSRRDTIYEFIQLTSEREKRTKGD